jgi:thioesterase domain-containing protein
VQLFVQIEKMTGKNLPLVTLFQAPTVEKLADILRDEGWNAPWSSLVPIQPGGSKPPFYCVHGVGGNIVEYLHLARYLGNDQPFYGLQAQGLDGKRPRHNTVEEMAHHYITEMRALQPEGPYFLGGSSFGGSVAYEIARQLHADGQKVGLLALFDTNGPGYGRLLPTTTYFKKTLYELKQRVEMHLSNLALLEPENRPEYIREKAGKVRKRIRIRFREFRRAFRKKMGMAPLPRAIKMVQESGNRAADIYHPQPYQGKVTLFRATQQPKGIYPDPTLGWEKLALGGLEIYDIPGHHGAIVREPRVRFLAQKLTECLSKNQEEKRD